MYALTNGHSYIGINSDKAATSVSNVDKALLFSEEKKASNYKDNLKSTLRKFNWQVIKVDDRNKSDALEIITENTYTYVETELEKSNFNISEFFNNTIETISQLRDYADNMSFLEKEYDKKILDVRHYKRDTKTKLCAIQLQRLEQFEILLERERYECKSNRMIAEIFLSDLSRLENNNYVDVIRNIKESEYKPKILTYEMLDDIVGKKRSQICKKN